MKSRIASVISHEGFKRQIIQTRLASHETLESWSREEDILELSSLKEAPALSREVQKPSAD